MPSAVIGLSVSSPIGMNLYESEGHSIYCVFLVVSTALFTGSPIEISEMWIRLGGVWTVVESLVMSFPLDDGIRAAPSGLVPSRTK